MTRSIDLEKAGALFNDSDSDIATNNQVLEDVLSEAESIGAIVRTPAEGVLRWDASIQALVGGRGVVIEGTHVESNSASKRGSRWVYRGADGPGLDVTGAQSITWRNMDIRHSNPDFVLAETRVEGDQVWPETELHVVSTEGFPDAGELMTRMGVITYTGRTATTFTGCEGGIAGQLPDDTPILNNNAYLIKSGRKTWDAAFFSFEHVTLGGLTAQTAKAGLVNLDRTIFSDFMATNFFFMPRAVVGGRGTNVVKFDRRCVFQWASNFPLYAPFGGQTWEIDNTGFEGCADGFVGAWEIEGVLWLPIFKGNWLGDNAHGERKGDWIRANRRDTVLIGGEVSDNLFGQAGDVEGNKHMAIWRWEGGKIGGNQHQGDQDYLSFESDAPKSRSMVIGPADLGPGRFIAGHIPAHSHIVSVDGYRTAHLGTGNVPGGSTSVTLAHGLALTPAVRDFTITPSTNPANDPGHVWISHITETHFRVNCRNDPGDAFHFQWRVDASRTGY